MAWTGLALTVEGRNALNQAQLSNRMNFKSIVVGDGSAPANFGTQKGLVHQLYEITDIKVDEITGGCTVTGDFPKVDYDYYFREIGLIVTTEDGEKLYVYDNCGDDAQYIVSSTGAETLKKRIRLSLAISDVAEITVSEPQILYVAYDEYEDTVEMLDTKIAEKEAKLREEITVESGRAQEAEEQLEKEMKAEVSRAERTEKNLQDKMEAEVNRAKEKESQLETAIGEKADAELVDRHMSDAVKHVTAAERTNWNDANTKKHTHNNKTVLDEVTSTLINGWNSAVTHILDTVKHVTESERTNWNDANTKKHTHSNKTVLDGITSTLINGWNSAVTHISDTVKHVTTAERNKWNNGSHNYGKCSTAAATQIKIVECAGFTLTEGAEVTVVFSNKNTASNPWMNVNGTGAKSVYYKHKYVPAGWLEAAIPLTFRYYNGVWNLTGYTSPSSVIPKGNGSAAIGTEETFACGDHVHPLQTSVSGNAGTATKLLTARKISVSGDVLGNGIAFDGTKDINILTYRRGCVVGQSGSATAKPWYIFATIAVNKAYEDRSITFHVSNKYGGAASRDIGILTAHFRTNGSIMMEDAQLVWEYALSDINPDNFVLAYKNEGSTVNVSLYTKIDVSYKHYHFDVISEGNRTERGTNQWELYSRSMDGGSSAISSGFVQVKSTLATLKNNVSNMLIPMYMGFQTLKGDKELTLQIKKFTFDSEGRTQWMTWEVIGLTKNYADVMVLCQPMYSNAGDIVCISWERAGTDVGKDKSRFIAMSSGWKNYTGTLWVTYFVAGTN